LLNQHQFWHFQKNVPTAAYGNGLSELGTCYQN